MLVVNAARHCVAEDTLAHWQDFVEKYKYAFDASSKEYALEHSEIYNKFVAMVEQDLILFLKKHNTSMNQFYIECEHLSKSNNEQSEIAVTTFVDLITMSTSFVTFADFMKSHEKREYFFHILRAWRQVLDESSYSPERKK